MGVMMVLMAMTVALMAMLVAVLVFVLAMAMMVVLVHMLGSCFVAVEPGHIVIVVLELLCKLDVEIAGVDAVLVYARNGNLKAADRKRGELFA